MSKKTRWKSIPREIKKNLLIMHRIIESGYDYSEDQYFKYVKPVIDYNCRLTFFDIPDSELLKKPIDLQK